jgi:hypothetical protein
LNLAVNDSRRATGAVSAPIRHSQQSSKLLPTLFAHLDTSRRLTILDLGRALPETIDFFAQYRCRIHVTDLYSELKSGKIERNSSDKTLQKQFQELFGFEAGTRLDLCLLWDLPHYLDEKQLRAFSSALWPWLHNKTRAHVFGVHSAATILLNREYGIIDRNNLSVRQRSEEQLKNSPHPQSFMSEWLTCFSSGSGVLLPDGKVENLLHATV